MLKMATYPGMTLGGEVRESISLDEDDMSDVEDEVFIRDGKNSYKVINNTVNKEYKTLTLVAIRFLCFLYRK